MTPRRAWMLCGALVALLAAFHWKDTVVLGAKPAPAVVTSSEYLILDPPPSMTMTWVGLSMMSVKGRDVLYPTYQSRGNINTKIYLLQVDGVLDVEVVGKKLFLRILDRSRVAINTPLGDARWHQLVEERFR